MVTFNDRRDDSFGPNTSQATRKGISDALTSGRRVTVSYAQGDPNTAIPDSVSGYLRQGEDGSIQVFHNSRSSAGTPLQDEFVQQICASRKNRNGSRDSFHGPEAPERWRDLR